MEVTVRKMWACSKLLGLSITGRKRGNTCEVRDTYTHIQVIHLEVNCRWLSTAPLYNQK